MPQSNSDDDMLKEYEKPVIVNLETEPPARKPGRPRLGISSHFQDSGEMANHSHRFVWCIACVKSGRPMYLKDRLPARGDLMQRHLLSCPFVEDEVRQKFCISPRSSSASSAGEARSKKARISNIISESIEGSSAKRTGLNTPMKVSQGSNPPQTSALPLPPPPLLQNQSQTTSITAPHMLANVPNHNDHAVTNEPGHVFNNKHYSYTSAGGRTTLTTLASSDHHKGHFQSPKVQRLQMGPSQPPQTTVFDLPSIKVSHRSAHPPHSTTASILPPLSNERHPPCSSPIVPPAVQQQQSYSHEVISVSNPSPPSYLHPHPSSQQPPCLLDSYQPLESQPQRSPSAPTPTPNQRTRTYPHPRPSLRPRPRSHPYSHVRIENGTSPSQLEPANEVFPSFNASGNMLKSKIRKGCNLFGIHLTIPSPVTARTVSQLGYDWACIDIDRSPQSAAVMAEMVASVKSTGHCIPVVRIPSQAEEWIRWAIDAGAQGIVLPNVANRSQVWQAVQSCNAYSNRGSWGNQSYDTAPWSSGGSPSRSDYNESSIMVIPHIEEPEAFEKIWDILAVRGIGAILVTPEKIQSFGVLPMHGQGPNDNSSVQTPIELLQSVSKAYSLPLVADCSNGDIARHWTQQGFKMAMVTTDTDVLARAAADQLHRARLQ